MSCDPSKDKKRTRKKARAAQEKQGTTGGLLAADDEQGTTASKALGAAMRVSASDGFAPFVDAHDIKESDSSGCFHPLCDKLHAFQAVDKLRV